MELFNGQSGQRKQHPRTTHNTITVLAQAKKKNKNNRLNKIHLKKI